ncbi:MAG: Ger(x)C family spore germination protein [Bacilli bacterium]|nr:Ger(x)C family spore germination protein [Bacilli bacterium]
MNKNILFLIIPLLLLTGCYDYKELNTISILSATEINKIDDKYVVSAQAVNPQAPDKTTTTQAPFIIYNGSGKTIQEAYRKITNETSKFLYSSHLQLLIINEKVAKENIKEIIDFYLKSPPIRTEFYILISKSDNVLDIITPINDISSSSIKETIENNVKYLGTTNTVTFNELTNMILDPNLEIVLPTIKLINDSKEGEKIENIEKTKIDTKYQLDGLAIFKDNKLQGYLNEEESKTYNILKNKINNTILTTKCDDNKYMTTEIIDSKSEINVKKNNIKIKIKLSGNLNEYHCNKPLDKTKTIKDIEKKFEKEVTNTLTSNINKIRKEYNSDIFGFLDKLYRTDYNKYKEIKNNWYKSTYQNIDISITSDISIISKGKVTGTIYEEN